MRGCKCFGDLDKMKANISLYGNTVVVFEKSRFHQVVWNNECNIL